MTDTIVISAKAGSYHRFTVIQHRTPGFRLKAGMTTFLAFIENVYIAIQSSIRQKAKLVGGLGR